MSNQVHLILGFHSHQPVGNFDFVFEEGFQKAYWPFLEVLERHPNIKVTLHYTGILYRWLVEHHPALNDKLKEMVRRGQIEMMTGGFYEPILSVIPDTDKQGQIRKLTSYIKDKVGYDAKGLWLAERVWEPQLASHLVDAGIQYTVTDDSHFRSAGLQEEQTWGYYLTEDAGKTLAIFPISERMRYLIPFEKPEKSIEFLRSVAERGGTPMVTMADDGEKFGIWPGTHDLCYTHGWLENFFMALEKNLDWIKPITFSKGLQTVKPLGRIYLPTASYAEMMEWAMPTPAILKYEDLVHYLQKEGKYDGNKPFVRGGFWRNFQVKYPESNNLHKKMVYVSNKVQGISNGKLKKKAPAELINQAQEGVYAGQTNCAYWHGVFGGLYLNYLRFALYRNLITAQTQVEQFIHQDEPYLDIEEKDFDCDGETDILVNTDKLNLYFKPAYGGCLFELDVKEKHFNLLDTLSRKPEAYHEKLKHGKVIVGQMPPSTDGAAVSIHDLVLAKEPGLENHLNYDWHQRYALQDHFMTLETSLDSFSKVKYKELGDFINQPYTVEIQKRGGTAVLTFSRKGHLWYNGNNDPVEIVKKITLSKDSNSYKAEYKITNMSQSHIKAIFGVEFNYALLAGNADDRYYYIPGVTLADKRLASIGENQNVSEVGLKDHWLKVDCNLKTSSPARLWRFPIETVSQSEGGFEKIYQSSVILPNWYLELSPGKSWSVTITQDIRHF